MTGKVELQIQKQIQIKLGLSFICHIHNYTEYNEEWNVFSAFTHPSVHTWSSGQPTVQRPGSSRGLPVGVGKHTADYSLPLGAIHTVFAFHYTLFFTLFFYVNMR